MFKYVNRWIKAGVLVVVVTGLIFVGIKSRPRASEVASAPQFAGALFLTNSANSTIDVLDEKFNRIIKSSTPMTGTGPGGLIAINDSSQKIFVAYPSTKKILVYDISSADKLFKDANTVTLSGYKDKNGVTSSFKTITSIKSVGQTIYVEQYDKGVKTSTIDIIAISALSPSSAQLFNIIPSYNMNLSGTPLMAVNASGTVLCVTQNDNLATSSVKDDAIKCFSPQSTYSQSVDPSNPYSNRQYWIVNALKEYSAVPAEVHYTDLAVTDYYGGQANYKVFAANSVAHKLTAFSVPKVSLQTGSLQNADSKFVTFGGTLGGLALGSGQIAGAIGQRLFITIGANSTISVIDPASTDYLSTPKLMQGGAPVPAKMVIGTSDGQESMYFVPVSSTQTGIDKYVTSAGALASAPAIHSVLQIPNHANIPVSGVAFGQAPLTLQQAGDRATCADPAVRFNNQTYVVSPGGSVTIPVVLVNPNASIPYSICPTNFTPQVTIPTGWKVSANTGNVTPEGSPQPVAIAEATDGNMQVSAKMMNIPYSNTSTALTFTFTAPLNQSNNPIKLNFVLKPDKENFPSGVWNLPVNISCVPTVTVNAVPYAGTGNHKLIYTIKNNSLACNATWSTVSRTSQTMPPAVITTPPIGSNSLTSNQVPSIAAASGIVVTKINGGMTTFTSSPGSAAKVTVDLDPNPADTYSSWYNLRANTTYYEWIYVSNLTYLATTFDKTQETFTATKFMVNGTSSTPPPMPNPAPGSTCLAPVIAYGNDGNTQPLPQSIVAGGTLTVPLQITNNNSASSNCSTQYTLTASTISGPAWTFQNYVFGASSPVASGNIIIPYLVGYPVSATLLAPRSPATVVTGAKLRFTISSISNTALSKNYDTVPINVTPSTCSPLTIRGNGWAPSSVPAGGSVTVPIKFINNNRAESLCSKQFVLLIGLPNGWTITDIDNTLFSAPYAGAPLTSRLVAVSYGGLVTTSITFQAPSTPANGGAITFTTMPSYSSQEQANFSAPVNVLSAVGVLGTPGCTLPANPVVTSLTGPTRVTINGVNTNVYNGIIRVTSQDTCNLVFNLGLKYLTNPLPAGWTATINSPIYNPSDYSDYYHTMITNIQILTPYGVNLNGNYGNVISATVAAGTGGQGTLR